MSRHGIPPGRTLRAAATLVAVALLGACQQSAVSPVPAQDGPSSAAASPTAGRPHVAGLSRRRTTPRGARPWWSDEIFYEVFVRSFQDSDGDGIGDLDGLTSRLDYLNDGDPATTDDLGVTALWLMPIAESPSYHGYDVTDYRAIEPDYGTTDDFMAFIAAAHERGIAVIVDLVLNHTSSGPSLVPGRHDRGLGARRLVRLVRHAAGGRQSDGSRVWHEAAGRYYYGYFSEGMPDLNLENPEVTAELDEVARFWLDEMGVDGFRLDAARHLIEDGKELENTPATFAWLEAFRERLKADHPDALILGEVCDSTSMSVALRPRGLARRGVRLRLRRAPRSSRSTRATQARSRPRSARSRTAYPADTLATFLTNHDQNRVAIPARRRLAARRSSRRRSCSPARASRSSTTARRSG